MLPVPRQPKICAVDLHVVMSLLYGVFAAAAVAAVMTLSFLYGVVAAAMILALPEAAVAWTDGLASEMSELSVISMRTVVVAQRK